MWGRVVRVRGRRRRDHPLKFGYHADPGIPGYSSAVNRSTLTMGIADEGDGRS